MLNDVLLTATNLTELPKQDPEERAEDQARNIANDG